MRSVKSFKDIFTGLLVNLLIVLVLELVLLVGKSVSNNGGKTSPNAFLFAPVIKSLRKKNLVFLSTTLNKLLKSPMPSDVPKNKMPAGLSAK